MATETPVSADQHTDWHKDPRTWELVRMLIKCRDALHNVPPDLDKQIERLIEPWAVSEGGI